MAKNYMRTGLRSSILAQVRQGAHLRSSTAGAWQLF